MFVNFVSFAVVFVGLASGANKHTLAAGSSCPNDFRELQSEPHFECTHSIDWRGDGFNTENCLAAIQRLYNVEVTKHGNTEFEFLLPGAIPYTSNPVMQTPRRYSVG